MRPASDFGRESGRCCWEENLKIRKNLTLHRCAMLFGVGAALLEDSNLVDPASSHMLVSKTKPCMSKYKCYTVKLRMAH